MARVVPLRWLGAAFAPEPAELARAVRRLAITSQREVAGALAGGYRSAFRGGGIEFEESRPYAPGDDPRAIDWNAFARSGLVYVKRYREERDQTLLLLVDVSASMAFGTAGPSKAALAARSAALLAAAAGVAGDRIGLWCFDCAVVSELRAGRGEAHRLRLLRALVAAGRGGAGTTSLAPVLQALHERLRRRAIVFLLSDLRDEALLADDAAGRRTRAALAAAARRHDLVVGHVVDPAERRLPRAGALRLADPEAPERSVVLRSGSRAARARYAAAAEARRREIERRLRGEGVDRVELPSDADPLRRLGRFFAERAARSARRRGARP